MDTLGWVGDARLEWTSTVVLGDGSSALIRPITPDDAPALAAFHLRQSPESRYKRYFSPKPELSPAELKRFTEVDMVDRAALVVELDGEFVGWGSYERWQDRDDAEVAFMVDDRHHGRGIATLLLEHLAAIAQTNGIRQFTAETLGDNRAMLAVFAKAGWPVHRHFDSGVVDLDFPLTDTPDFRDSVEQREHRADSRAVARLLLPSSIAVIGASDRPGTVGHALWRNVTAGAARGRDHAVHPVNPRHDTVGGVPAYRSVTEIEGEVGLAVIAVPVAALEATIQECIDKRVRSAVVVTAVEGPDFHPQIDVPALVTHARRNGLRILGPGSMGLASPRPSTAIQAALVDVTLPPGNVAISMQSGTLAASLLRLAHRLRLGVSWFVSLGDKADVSANDLLQFWEDDDATRVIALYTESLGNPRKFARIARRVGAQRPIVVVRTGAAQVGAGNEALYRETGAIEVPTVTALLDTVRVLSSQPLMGGPRVAVVTNSRSPAVLATATLEAAGLEPVIRPVPGGWGATADDYRSRISAAIADPDVHAVMIVHAPPVEDAVAAPIDAIEAATTGADKPAVAVMIGAVDGPLRPGSTVPVFAFVEPAAAALGRIAAYSRWRSTEGAEDPSPPADIDQPRAGAVIAACIAAGGDVPPPQARELLAAYGIDMPVTVRVPATEAVEAATSIGFPVAIKAVHRRAGRSTQAGVGLDIGSVEAARQALTQMADLFDDEHPDVVVQEMIAPGIDLRIRVETDDRLGPVISVGLGGMHADVIGDAASRLAPISLPAARALLAGTRAAAALDEAAFERATDTIVRVAQLASDHPAIAELDLNPVIVGAERCTVADATVRLDPTSRVQPAVRRLESS